MAVDRKGAASSRPVDLVVRFTTSIPDLVIAVTSPDTTSVLSLKQRIRSQVSTDFASSRLRLIASGKVLVDTKAISESISIPPQPPRATTSSQTNDYTGKGKATLRSSPPPQPNQRVYIHCSIGDALNLTELEDEKAAAVQADEALISSRQTAISIPAPSNEYPKERTVTQPAPRGFDRLLDSGFSADEVATLRTQFLAIQAHAHTPDTMPTGDDLRALEDRWLDTESGAAGTGTTAGDGEGGFGAENGGLEDMLWGNVMGFFWPIAGVFWLMREEGVWSGRRQIAVLSGMLVNITFGFLRLSN